MKDTGSQKPIGVIGAGSFGTAIAYLLSKNNPVLIYARNNKTIESINIARNYKGVTIPENIRAVRHIDEVAETCSVIFPVVPSSAFRSMMKLLGPMLNPSHILIHGTKGLDLIEVNEEQFFESRIAKENVRTMSEVILEESPVLRVGCLSGPNLAREILADKPTATVIASEYDEVIKMGQEVLSSDKFFVFGSHQLRGAELSGVFKNIIALASGILGGMDLGKNIQSTLIARGLREMVYLGKALGAESKAFIGTAGVGDLVATATSESSRNYSFGKKLAQGNKPSEILAQMDEVAEGVRTLKIAEQFCRYYRIDAPITKLLFQIIYNDYPIDRAIERLMSYPFAPDVDFL